MMNALRSLPPIARLAVFFALAGCTAGGSRTDSGATPPDGARVDAPTGGPGTLRIEPADAEVVAADGAPGVLDYRAIYTNDAGGDEDVSGEAFFSLGASGLGSFTANRFTSATDRGGRTLVLASARGRMATTTLTVRLRRSFLGPGASADDPARFEGTDDPARAPELVYPPDGILVPPNLNELEVHYRPSTNDVFELSFVGSTVDVRVYFGCTALGAGCGYTPEEVVWRAIAEAERGLGPVRYRIRGVSRSTPGRVGATAERTIEFSEEDVQGGIYYWNAGAGAIRRYDFGLRGQRAENYIDAPRAGAMTCVGCHVLSRDGSRIAVGIDIPAPSPYRVYEVSTRRELNRDGSTFGGGGANFFTFSPDSRQMMTSNGATIVLRETDTGRIITEPLVDRGAMPDWAPDGERMVYARPSSSPPCFPGFPCGAPGVDSASLETHLRSGTTWSAGPALVPFTGQNNYYPAYSPDGAWVLFNRSPSNANSFDAPDAQVWIVPSSGGTARHLARASSGGDSWPKWDPTVYVHRGGGLMWMTFASRRAYGLRTSPGERAQIWMTAFDPRRAEAGEDGSYPAFWLPFQELESGNHIAQWVTRVDRQPCTANTDCPGGEFCSGGVCVPDLI